MTTAAFEAERPRLRVRRPVLLDDLEPLDEGGGDLAGESVVPDEVGSAPGLVLDRLSRAARVALELRRALGCYHDTEQAFADLPEDPA